MNMIAEMPRRTRRVWRTARSVSRETRVRIWGQFWDMIRLKRRSRLGPDDYYRYALFDRDRVPDLATAATYGGWRLFEEFRHFSDPQFHAIAHKHVLYRLLHSFGLPVPAIRKIYAPVPDCFERHRALQTPRDLKDFLRTTDDLPMFGKPSNSAGGYGAMGIVGRLSSHRLELLDGRIRSLDSLVDEIHAVAMDRRTFLFTEMLVQRPDIRELCGDTVASLRTVMLVRRGRPEVFRVAILLPTSRQQTSNSLHLTSGTMVGKVDPDTGRISNVVTSTGPFYEYSEYHAETGARIEGVLIEDWPRFLELMHEAAMAMSPFRMQHWDVALTTRGPVLMEMNVHGAEDLLQMHGPPGVYDEQYLSFARDHKVW